MITYVLVKVVTYSKSLSSLLLQSETPEVALEATRKLLVLQSLFPNVLELIMTILYQEGQCKCCVLFHCPRSPLNYSRSCQWT